MFDYPARVFLLKFAGMMIVTMGVSLFAMTDPAAALKVGDWEGVCMAPNHLTGKIERVIETEVSVRPLHPWFARTSRMPDGSWQIDFNVFAMLANRLSNDAKKFIYYHECTHARLNESNEREADCQGLAQMKREMVVTDQAIKDVKHAYLLILRTFPTGGPCDQPAVSGQQTAETD